MRDRAQTVVVGAGIVGVSAAYHLAELGQPDVLVLDQGPLFETGGSSSHAPGLAFQTNGSRMMCRIAQESVALYATLDVDGELAWYGVGGIEVATTEARMQELNLRLEKGYRLWGQDIDTEHDPFEAGLGFAVKIDQRTFQGRDALVRTLERGPTRRLSCMTLDDPVAVVLGREPIRSGERVVGYATSAGYGYSVGRCIVYGYLPAELAVPDTPVEIEYFDERLPATVAGDPLWDPKGERLRA
jgi:hypothetical protein